MVKGGIRTSTEKVEEKKEESKLETLIKQVENLTKIVRDISAETLELSKRISKLEKELW